MGASGASRRAVLTIGSVGAAGVALAGCEVYGGDSDSGTGSDQPPPTAAAGTVLANTADVPVGGGVIVDEFQVVVTQPTEGEFRGFSAICTHQGCTVAAVAEGTINCDCHGSRFSIEDGSVVQAASGLSPENQDPLPEAEIVVDGDQVTLP
jgi:Rieske Fe-S protein